MNFTKFEDVKRQDECKKTFSKRRIQKKKSRCRSKIDKQDVKLGDFGIGKGIARSNCFDVVKWSYLNPEDEEDGEVVEGLVRSGHAAFEDEKGSLILVGGGKGPSVDVSRLEVDEIDGRLSSRVTKLKVGDGKLPSRFAFAHTYCEREKLLFMHGGLDDQCTNHCGTRFLVSDGAGASVFALRGELERAGPSPRGYHSAVCVDVGGEDFVYCFGGQCCVGGPYQFYSSVHRFSLRRLRWEEVECADPPSPRSQCFAFVYKNFVYVYGGYDGNNIFTDLHRLDLSSHRWERVSTNGQEPSGLKGLTPFDFHIYFCRPTGVVVGRRLLLLTENYEQSETAAFMLDLRTLRWTRLNGISSLVPPPPVVSPSTNELLPLPKCVTFNPPARGSPTLSFIQNKYFLFAGGHPRTSSSSDQADRVWRIEPPVCLDWSRERLLWLACIKNRRDVCPLAACPPHIIYKIIGLVNSNSFCLKKYPV